MLLHPIREGLEYPVSLIDRIACDQYRTLRISKEVPDYNRGAAVRDAASFGSGCYKVNQIFERLVCRGRLCEKVQAGTN